MKKLKLKLYFFSSALCISFFANSQAPPIEWEKSYGGSNNDEGWYIIQTKDSGFIIAGASESDDDEVTGNHGYGDYWVIKLNSSGTLEWEQTYGGSLFDGAYSIIQTTDGGYAMAGSSASDDSEVTGNHGREDFWIVKLDSVGDLIWEKSLGGSGSDVAFSIIQTTDGGYAIAGEDSSDDGNVTNNHGNYDCWVVKLDSAGDLIWEKSLGGSGYDVAYSIIQAKDRGYVVAGVSDSNDGDVTGNHGSWDYWIVKLDTMGNIVWEQSYGGSNEDGASSIIQTTDGGYVVAGYSTSDDGDITNNHGDYDYWVVKLDSTGTLLWQKSYGGSDIDVADGIIQTSASGYSIAGFSNSNNDEVTGNHGGFDYWVIDIDSIGDLIWEESLGGSQDDYANSILQTNNGSYIVVGYSDSNNGNVTGNHGDNDYWIVKLGTATRVQEVNNNYRFSIYPNPATGHIVVQYQNYQPGMSLAIYNCLGQVLQQQPVINTDQQIDVSHLAAGLYMVCIKQSNEVVASGKFVKE